jgi:5'-nucleotidase
MTLVLTNDDGIAAPGIRALLTAATALGQKTVIIAPRHEQSGCGHQVTTRTPIQVERWAEHEWAIAGTPADCTRLALTHLCPHAQWVLSGINAGGNLGSDVYISGTVAAVREAALHGLPGIAISHYRQGQRAIDWELAAHLTAKVLLTLCQQPLSPGTYWNVNLPHLEPGAKEPEIVLCRPCTQPLPVAYQLDGEVFIYKGDYSKRNRDPGGDVDICFGGKIAVTQLAV